MRCLHVLNELPPPLLNFRHRQIPSLTIMRRGRLHRTRQCLRFCSPPSLLSFRWFHLLLILHSFHFRLRRSPLSLQFLQLPPQTLSRCLLPLCSLFCLRLLPTRCQQHRLLARLLIIASTQLIELECRLLVGLTEYPLSLRYG